MNDSKSDEDNFKPTGRIFKVTKSDDNKILGIDNVKNVKQNNPVGSVKPVKPQVKITTTNGQKMECACILAFETMDTLKQIELKSYWVLSPNQRKSVSGVILRTLNEYCELVEKILIDKELSIMK